MSELKLDKNTISVSTFKDRSDDDYWHSCTPEERLQAMEINRQAAYGKSITTQRVQRVLEVVKRP